MKKLAVAFIVAGLALAAVPFIAQAQDVAIRAKPGTVSNVQTSMGEPPVASGNASAPEASSPANEGMVSGSPGVSEGSPGGMEGEVGRGMPHEIAPPPQPAPVTECHPEGYLGRRVLAEGESKTANGNEIDPRDIKQPHRILFPDSMTTMDYSAGRLNLIIDHKTRIVLMAKCG